MSHQIEAEAAVGRGAQFLDEQDQRTKASIRWWHRLNLILLNLRNCDDCVLGQIFGNYDDAIEDLYLTPQDAIDLGFNIDLGKPETVQPSFTELQTAWTKEIRQRRGDLAAAVL